MCHLAREPHPNILIRLFLLGSWNRELQSHLRHLELIMLERAVIVAIEIVDETRAHRIAARGRNFRRPSEHALLSGANYGLMRSLRVDASRKRAPA
jgi:hypothetical protein